MTPTEARSIVRRELPNAQHNSNDFNYHWIEPGPPISEAFLEDEAETEIWMNLARDGHDRTDEEHLASFNMLMKIQQDAEDRAWINAAERILTQAKLKRTKFWNRFFDVVIGLGFILFITDFLIRHGVI